MVIIFNHRLMIEVTLYVKALSIICSSFWKCIFLFQFPSCYVADDQSLWSSRIKCYLLSILQLLLFFAWSFVNLYIIIPDILNPLISRFNFNYSLFKYILLNSSPLEIDTSVKSEPNPEWSIWGSGLRSWRLGFCFSHFSISVLLDLGHHCLICKIGRLN